MRQKLCFEKNRALAICSTEKFRAIEEVIDSSSILKRVAAGDKLKKAVIDRENQQCTGFGHGVAVAHGKMNGLKEVYIAMGVSRKGIEYNSYDGEPVRILFVVASPPELQQEYLELLCDLMNILKDGRFRKSLVYGLPPRRAARILFDRFSEKRYRQAS
ncbi:MAG: PTS sugar transporter subunit IIA [Spirochaetales bacterium]|nr:PTS sugar transporter subunit IIA [Spirochaetales bacterium]